MPTILEAGNVIAPMQGRPHRRAELVSEIIGHPSVRSKASAISSCVWAVM